MNLASVFDWSAIEYPGKTAIVFGGKHFTYKQVGDTVNQIANALISTGIGKGDKVALSCPNLPYFPMVPEDGLYKADLNLKGDMKLGYYVEVEDTKEGLVSSLIEFV